LLVLIRPCSFCRAMYFLNQKGISTDEVVVIGSSAGAHLGAVLAYDKRMHREYGICIHSSCDPIVEAENSIHFAEKVNSLDSGLAEF
jgi:acetyl esterase/lipase